MAIDGVKNTRDLLGPQTRICALVVAPPKCGKTTWAASLDAVTRKHRGKPSIILACEAAEGGGTMSVADLGIAYKVVKNWQDMESLLAQLQTDDEYGGVILDNATDYYLSIVKPYALAFPSKEESSKFAGTRKHGVSQQSDFPALTEFSRQHVARLIRLTGDHLDARYRKDLIVTALEKERKNREGVSQGFHPDLPGQLAGAVSAMFQSVVWIKKDAKVVDAGKPTARRMDVRTLISGGDAERDVMGDRMGLFPMESSLTDADGKPVGLLPLYEQWLEQVTKKAA